MVPTTLHKRRPIDRMRWLQLALALAAGVFGLVLMTHGSQARGTDEGAIPCRHSMHTAVSSDSTGLRAQSADCHECCKPAD